MWGKNMNTTTKTDYVIISHHENEGQNFSLLIANKTSEIWQSSDIWEWQ
jgi:hypothetical protein